MTFNDLDLDLTHLQADSEQEKAVFRLLANIVHEGTPKNGSYKVQIRQTVNNKWIEIQDLIKNEILKELVEVSEGYI